MRSANQDTDELSGPDVSPSHSLIRKFKIVLNLL